MVFATTFLARSTCGWAAATAALMWGCTVCCAELRYSLPVWSAAEAAPVIDSVALGAVLSSGVSLCEPLMYVYIVRLVQSVTS